VLPVIVVFVAVGHAKIAVKPRASNFYRKQECVGAFRSPARGMATISNWSDAAAGEKPKRALKAMRALILSDATTAVSADATVDNVAWPSGSCSIPMSPPKPLGAPAPKQVAGPTCKNYRTGTSRATSAPNAKLIFALQTGSSV